MKFCTRFHTDFRYEDKIDEIIFIYKETNTDILDLIQNKYSRENLTVILNLEELSAEELLKSMSIFTAIKELHPNFKILLPFSLSSYSNIFKEKEINYFYNLLIDRWDDLVAVVKDGVSDAYICNELAFELKDIRKIFPDLTIRIFPNVCQTSNKFHNDECLTNFFVRPEDVAIYETCVDVMEFFGTIDRQSVLYEIYSNRKWLGDLRDLIIGLDISIYSKYLVPHFGVRRLNCGKVCNKNKCSLCPQMYNLGKKFKENNLIINYEQEKRKNEEEETKISTQTDDSNENE